MKKMGVLGPLGTHSEAAAQYLSRLLPERPELLVYPDFFAVIQAVEDGEVDSCLVPVENSLEGAINITLDTLARSADLFVESELIWPVHNRAAFATKKEVVTLINLRGEIGDPINMQAAIRHVTADAAWVKSRPPDSRDRLVFEWSARV